MVRHLLLLFAVVSAVTADNTINNYIRQLLENLRPTMPVGIPELGVPPMDPLSVPAVRTNIKEGVADIDIDVDSLRVTGLSSFTTDRIDASLEDLRLTVGFSFDQINGDGNYDLKGKVLIFPLYGQGRAFFSVEDVVVQLSSALENNNGTLQMKSFNLVNLQIGRIQIHLENLLGGGDLGAVVNTLMNSLGVRLFNLVRPLVINLVGDEIFNLINRELGKISIEEIIGGILPQPVALQPFSNQHYTTASNNYVDQLLENVRQMIVDSNLDPLSLPDLREGFSKRILFVTVHGEAKLYDGRLGGLASIYRSGDATLQASGQSLQLTAGLGLRRLAASYSGSAKFMDLGPTIRATVYVDGVTVTFRASQSLTAGASPLLEDFRISNVGNLSVRIDGLGPLGWILGKLTGAVGNLIKETIVREIEGPIWQIIRDELSKITIPV